MFICLITNDNVYNHITIYLVKCLDIVTLKVLPKFYCPYNSEKLDKKIDDSEASQD